MGYRLENKSIDLGGLRQLNYVPSKKAGDIYRYKNDVIRIFKEGENPIDEETARYLTGISTDRVLLPRKLLFYNSAFKGYTLKLVSQKGASRKMVNAPKMDVVDAIGVVESDIYKLSQKKVLLSNTGIGHTLYNGDLYLVDPSQYRILDYGDEESLRRLNQYHLHLLVGELISTELRNLNFPKASIAHMKEIMEIKDVDQPTSDYLYEIIGNQKDIKRLVKKL
jgi:hypothetical protein